MRRLFVVCTTLAGCVAAYGQISPAETIKAMRLSDGFQATVFAGEPDVRQPISFAIDDRGRLWVAENYSYPNWNPEGRDRIVVFEDVDGDGRFDKRTVFYDRLNYVTGIEVGFGGVWVVSAPNLLFIPDRDGDLVPDGPPRVVLDGFGHEGVHNLVNGCAWGPDGWLYGGHGNSSWSVVGAPGAGEGGRVKFDGGVWRYHPTKKRFEVVAEGTTNPWGIDWDDYGQAFISNSVTPHIYQVIPGAHFSRHHEGKLNPYVYERIDTVADHLHWVGAKWSDSRGGTAEQVSVGGGHAHCGCMIYLGESFPVEYRGLVFMNNLHGDRINNDLLEQKGSGYVAHHGRDFMVCGDKWYQGLLIKYGPDGGVYVADWYDTGECHTKKPDLEHGRIYKITYRGTKPAIGVDMAKMSDAELVRCQLSRNEWFVRHARRVLQERGANPVVESALREILKTNPDATRKLRAIWALWAVAGLSEGDLLGLLDDNEPYVRGWGIQLLAEDGRISEKALDRFRAMAADDPSPVVRLFLASAMQRIPVVQRRGVMERLLSHGEDSADQNLPQMYWYAMEPMTAAEPTTAIGVATRGRVAKVREWVARRVAAE